MWFKEKKLPITLPKSKITSLNLRNMPKDTLSKKNIFWSSVLQAARYRGGED